MHTVLLILQIIFSIGIVITVLLQPEGTGLSSSWGGGGTYHTKRGVEKIVFYATIALIVLFTITSILQLVI